jgi:hypothetical protein
VGRENIFKMTIGNESLQQDSNDSGVRIVKLPLQRIWLLRARCSYIEIFINTPALLLTARLTTTLITY